MLQRLFRGQSEQADAIATATDTLDAAIEDAQTQRDALQAQYDALQKQISELWSQSDEICRQMYELDEAMRDAAGEIGDTGVTVQIYSRGSSRRRAESDDEIRRQLEDLDRQKGEIIREMTGIENKYGFDGSRDGATDAVRADLDRYDELEERNNELGDTMGELFAEAPDIDENDFENY